MRTNGKTSIEVINDRLNSIKSFIESYNIEIGEVLSKEESHYLHKVCERFEWIIKCRTKMKGSSQEEYTRVKDFYKVKDYEL